MPFGDSRADTPSVDRINYDGDYEKNNVNIVCVSCNIGRAMGGKPKTKLREYKEPSRRASQLLKEEKDYILNNYKRSHNTFGGKSLSRKFNCSQNAIKTVLGDKY